MNYVYFLAIAIKEAIVGDEIRSIDINPIIIPPL